MSTRASRGFTMVELLISLVVLTILLFMGVPLTMQWVRSSNQQAGQTLFVKGMAMAKSRTLRNSAGAQQNEPAAFLLLSGGNVVCVQEASYSTAASATNVPRTPGNSFSCSGSVWTGTLPSGTTGLLNNAATQCVALNNAGLPVSTTLGGTSCGTAASYQVSGMSSALTLN
ncbi:pilus assembly FimT family protein [Silvimonas iriomotensis]|nr:prepilin-type N-terminal cleavage/methylation domain-containing protein [Silvimonas iriomotensis]